VYGHVWFPDAGMKSHPFSVTHIPGQTDQLRIIFRVFGNWTDLLARSLIQLLCPGHQQEFLPIPEIMMDGWHGPNHLVGSAFDHDKVKMVCAGIGIAAFLSMSTELTEIFCFDEDGVFIKKYGIKGVPLTKDITLHWLLPTTIR
jgi:predicted ferric reductase